MYLYLLVENNACAPLSFVPDVAAESKDKTRKRSSSVPGFPSDDNSQPEQIANNQMGDSSKSSEDREPSAVTSTEENNGSGPNAVTSGSGDPSRDSSTELAKQKQSEMSGQLAAGFPAKRSRKVAAGA
eukprot:CAMPEP_0114278412 /NCGR_PEP_ID=MMETSP0059-20121206/1325_1 /TAXON_ID=36894 /ORGANISM="Pyramimonas parkeae, Strain CCMP726" /LENGTH=127 /DNA_ID=CAMNT_0001398613 /DNA_START=483 /DNA_END=867 /DNA_ORIENTATION=-